MENGSLIGKSRLKVCVLLCLLFDFSFPGYSAGVVNSLTDSALRTAIAGGGNITFSVNGTIALTNTLLISSDTTIDASGHTLTIDGKGTNRLFQINSLGQLKLLNLGLINGSSTNESSLRAGEGGAILSEGMGLEINHCWFSNHVARGAFNPSLPSADPGRGGAIYSLGKLVILDSTFQNSVAQGGSAPSPGPASGGAIYQSSGSCQISNSVFNRNGSIAPAGSLSDEKDSSGGAIFISSGSLDIDSSTFNRNYASADPNYHQRIGSSRGGAVFVEAGVLTVSRSFFASNSVFGGGGYFTSPNQGGAIFSSAPSVLNHCEFVANTATGSGPGGDAAGGALYFADSFTLSSSILANNSVGGGNAYPPPSPHEVEVGTGWGGGLFNAGNGVVERTAFMGNFAFGGRAYHYNGGDARGANIAQTNASLFITNCTISQSGAFGGSSDERSGGGGLGAIYSSNSVMRIIHGTVAANNAYTGGGSGTSPSSNGGLYLQSPGDVILYNTILSSNSTANVSGVVTDGSANISSDNSLAVTSASSRSNTDPLLGPSQSNGGGTLTFGLLSGSPAINSGDNAHSSPTDQRGVSRPQDSQVDIGAFEALSTHEGVSQSISYDGGYKIQLSGPSSQPFVLQSSTNLFNWGNVFTNSFDQNGTYSTVRPLSSTVTYYRTVSP